MRVDPTEVRLYLRSKGLSDTHIAGILANIQGESGFNAGAVGDNGASVGLFQHQGPRRRALEQMAGTSSPTWQQQVDYALSEPEGKAYVSQQFETPNQATDWFVRKFERPANPDADSRKRQGFLPQFTGADVRMASADAEMPPEMQVPGDPRTGAATMPFRPAAAFNPAAALSGLDMGGQEYQPREMSYADRLAVNPLFNIGLGILGAQGNYGDWLGAVAQGTQAGLANVSVAQRSQMMFEMGARRAFEDDEEKRTRRKVSERLMAAGYPDRAALAREGKMSEALRVDTPNAPSGYAWTPEGALQAIPGGPADPSTQPPAEPTSAMRNYEFLVSQGVPPAEAQKQAFGGGGTTVNVGEAFKVPTGYMPAAPQQVDPNTGQPLPPDLSQGVKPIPGTEEAEKRRMAQAAMSSAISNIQAVEGFIGRNEHDMFGKNAAEIRQRRSQIIADIAKLRDMGVLQQGEMERIEESLPDPTTIGSVFTGDETMATAYRILREQFSGKLDAIQGKPAANPSDPLGLGSF